MIQDIRSFAQFISVERGLMLFMISIGATFLAAQALNWTSALLLGTLVFCVWSAVDAMNNICDVDLDIHSDPNRAQFTKRLGRAGLAVAVIFSGLSLALGALTQMPYVVLFTGLGLFFGVVYSVPPFRLRKTPLKPIVNFTVGAVPIMIIAAFFNTSSLNVISLVMLIGATTAINSLWEDLADYESDYQSGSRTIPIIMGFHRGLLFTVAMGYTLLPLMVLVGVLFQLPLIYYLALTGLAAFITLRLVYKRETIFSGGADTAKLLRTGTILARDFVIVAVVFTLALMLSSILKIA
ncbi:UbiA family prenyltransferase [Candidatus Bathyarchaeota archaeon]|mgnify:CR=1 FL=1|nr:UbiA family prenyltransferase [Candidatus Bathyarchaeota archaeon]